MTDKLRECPFCGGEAEDGRVFDTNCKNPSCPIYGINFSIDHWQTRPTEDRLREELTEARLHECKRDLCQERIPHNSTLHKRYTVLKRVRELEGDAKRMRWMLSGNGYFMEEHGLCGHGPCDEKEQNEARAQMDQAMMDDEPITPQEPTTPETEERT